MQIDLRYGSYGCLTSEQSKIQVIIYQSVLCRYSSSESEIALHPWIRPTVDCLVFTTEKIHEWSLAVQTCVAQGAAVLGSFSLLPADPPEVGLIPHGGEAGASVSSPRPMGS